MDNPIDFFGDNVMNFVDFLFKSNWIWYILIIVIVFGVYMLFWVH